MECYEITYQADGDENESENEDDEMNEWIGIVTFQ